MTDYITMINRISSEVGGVTPASTTTSPTLAEIKAAILSAIDHYTRMPFYFLQSRALTFNTVAAQEYYTSADLAAIPNIAHIDALSITVSGIVSQLDRRSFDYIEAINSTTATRGRPTDYCYYAKQIRLAPYPDAVYSIRIAGDIRLAALSADADTNAWMTDAEPLIRFRASYDLWANVLADEARASVAERNEMKSYSALLSEGTQRGTSGKIKATRF